jgi:hypothetical protein
MRKEYVVSCITKLYSINNNIRKKKEGEEEEISYSPIHSLSLSLSLFSPTCSTTHHHSHPHFCSIRRQQHTRLLLFSLLLTAYIPHLLPSLNILFFLTINVHTILSNKTFLPIRQDKMTLSYF